jgi:tRNA (adenine37-N6)-methyltransferase
MASPPSLENQKVGLFSSRSPHRPNSIGLSLVPIHKITKNKIYISKYDLINETPILDIKPYIKYSDTPVTCTQGWLEDPSFVKSQEYNISYSVLAKNQIHWLGENSDLCFEDFVNTQLKFWPKSSQRKRISQFNEDTFVISYRTWRIEYTINEADFQILITKLYSGYSQEDLNKKESDLYFDKAVHSLFLSQFKSKH